MLYLIVLISMVLLSSCDSALEPVFLEDGFELCNLPLPIGYPNSWTHVGIEYVKDGYNGYRYFLTCTPYPNGDDDFENPMFFYANPREDNIPPIDFVAYHDNPLQKDPGDGYNADPDIIYYDSTLFVTNRPFIRLNTQWVNVQKCIIVDSKFQFAPPITLYDNQQSPFNFGVDSTYFTTVISPSVVFYKGALRFYQLITNSYNDNMDCKGVIVMKGDSFRDSCSFTLYNIGKISKFNAKPWHFDLFTYKEKLYAIICAYVHKDPTLLQRTPMIRRFFSSEQERVCYQYLAYSEDGLNFKVFDKPLTTINSYRSSGFVREDGMFIMYISTLNYTPDGNLSLDGRNIMLTYKPFDQVLKELQPNKNELF